MEKVTVGNKTGVNKKKKTKQSDSQVSLLFSLL